MKKNVLINFLLTMLTQRPAELLTSKALMMDMCPKLDRSHRTACFWGQGHVLGIGYKKWKTQKWKVKSLITLCKASDYNIAACKGLSIVVCLLNGH